jgi:hypothetical protein
MSVQEQVTLSDVIDTTTDEYQYRLVCLKLAHMAQQVEGDMNLELVMARADRYWEFIIGTDDEPEVASMEVKGSA